MVSVFHRTECYRVVLLSFLLLAISTKSNTYAQSEKPDGSRFTPVVLTEGATMEEPMAFEVLDDGRVFIIERTGALKLFNPADKSVKTVAQIPVNTKYTNAEGKVREAEEGLVGLTVHPDFDTKPWVYLLYADPDEPKHVFARWDFKDDKLVESTKKVVFEFPVQRQECCHTGGGMVWDKDQNLFITIGNNTGNNLSAHTDERPGREVWDDQRGAANTNDLRGKNLRIHPEDDGTYSIPAGNLFPPGTPDTRPEIYTMGHRNTWRISIDNHTGYIYWGEVGPDAVSDTELGPRGYDELNQAKGPGFFGWPYFISENIAYPFYDYAADKPMAPKDAMKPINNSVNNTGLKELPPAQPAFISYPYGVSENFPLVGSGGRSATGGPIYRQSDFENPERPFPAYFEGMWFAADLSRGWIMAISMDENSDYKSMEPFVPAYNPAEIIDMKFGPEGDLYVLEYGSRWFQDSDDDKLVRIEYNAGNRTPIVAASANKTGGRIPLEVTLSADGSMDYDGDMLTYEWAVKHDASGELKVYEGDEANITLDKKGRYTAELTVKDPAGASNSKTLTLIAGNEPPEVRLNLAGNKSFFFPDTPIGYDVTVQDAEDGDLATGKIDPSQVAISIDYISEGFDYAEVMQGQRSVDASTRYAIAQALMAQSDCSVCHQPDVRSAGPAYTEIAEKYQSGPDVTEKLVDKIRNGGSGVWGEINMPAHPAITENDARTIVDYLLHFNDQTLATLPASGSYDLTLPEEDTGRGSLVIRSAYTDRGAENVSPLASEEVVILRSPSMDPGSADVIEGAEVTQSRGRGPLRVNAKAGGHIAFHAIDLSGISTIELLASASPRAGAIGGMIEVRKGSVAGELLGMAEIKVSTGGGWRQRAEPVSIDISGQTGQHDLFFLFKNAEARPIDPLFVFSNISFAQDAE
ncbi:MAG: PQQ-dependent sugar dehydrogenase [Rhodothermales bacterium]